MKHKTRALLAAVGATANALSAVNAQAALECQDMRYPGGGFACASKDEERAELLTLRKMPTWGGNSGLLVIDLCEYPRESELFKEISASESRIVDLTGRPVPGVNPLLCVRRVCSEEESQFALTISGLPIPIGWVSLELTLGFATSRFEVRCSNLGRTGGGGS